MCVESGGENVALFNVGGTVYAIADTCTHEGAPLSDGGVDGTVVTCPWHGASFDVTTGGLLGPPASAPVSSYQVRVDSDEIQIAGP